MDQDWDNLIILDACRYDAFQEVNSIKGRLFPVISKGSNTGKFLRGNFTSNTYSDTIYISANPQVTNHQVGEKFFRHFQVWKTHWDENYNTVCPPDMVEKGKEVAVDYPHKKYIFHFIQPHYPFIGDLGQSIIHRSITGDGLIDEDSTKETIWSKLESGGLSKETVWQAYMENLELTLPHVERLTDYLEGKTVITSDHGNAFGRWGVYGHPPRHYMRDLVEVPWLVLNDSERRIVTRGSGNTQTNAPRIQSSRKVI